MWPLKFRIKQCKNNRNHRIPQAFARCHHIVQLHNAMEVPSADSHTAACKSGSLQKLSSRSFPYLPHPWKRKHCVLVRSNLFYYDRDDSKGGDRGSGVINLEYYDQVVEAAAKECKKASNVFVITSQDRSFFEQGRHLFSADSHSDMLDWVGVLKKAIEQIRNNHRTTTTSSATNSTPSLNPSSKTESKATVGPSPKPDSKIFVGPKLDALRGRTKKREEGEEDGQGGDKGKKRRGGESAEAKGDNKENVEDWYNSKERKQKYSDSSLRRRRANPSSRSMDESSLETEILKGGNPVVKKKVTENASESTSTSSSLGRKQTTKTKPSQSQGAKSSPVELKFATGDLEGMMFGSLGRQLKNEKGKGSEGLIGEGASEGGAKGGKAAGGSNLERRKRKADDDGDVELRVTESGPQLESITKHRVRGPTGRRVPQNRRTQQLLMKHRASSLSALAQNDSGEVIKPSEDSAARSGQPPTTVASKHDQVKIVSPKKGPTTTSSVRTNTNSVKSCDVASKVEPRSGICNVDEVNSSELKSSNSADIKCSATLLDATNEDKTNSGCNKQGDNESVMNANNIDAIGYDITNNKLTTIEEMGNNCLTNVGNDVDLSLSITNSSTACTDNLRNTSNLTTANTNTNNNNVDCFVCLLCSNCSVDLCVCLQKRSVEGSDKMEIFDGKKEHDDDISNPKKEDSLNESQNVVKPNTLCSKCGEQLQKTYNQLNDNSSEIKDVNENNNDDKNESIIRKKIQNVQQIETIEIIQFDDIDDALFFKPSIVIHNDIHSSLANEKKIKFKDSNYLGDNSLRKSIILKIRRSFSSIKGDRPKIEVKSPDEYPEGGDAPRNNKWCVIL